MHSIYKAFDQFALQPDFSVLSLSNILLLPLAKLFISIPDSHWLLRHPKFLASHFFIYDDSLNRLWLRVRGEYAFKPGLCYRLYKDILQHRTIRLQPYLWKYILADPPVIEDDLTADTLSQQFRNQQIWQKFTSSKFRQTISSSLFQSKVNVPKVRLKLFWTTSMLLQARTVWYRVLNFKLPTMSYLHHIQTTDSNQCRLCQDQEETMGHFLIFCSGKYSIWKSILHNFYPDFNLRPESIQQLLRFLKPPNYFPHHMNQHLFIVVSTSLWYIWYFHWQFVIHNIPYQPNLIISKIISQVSILTNEHSLIE